MKPGLYSVCDSCHEPTRAEVIKPVQVHEPTLRDNGTRWLCSVCRRNMRRRSEHEEGDHDVSQHD